MWQPTAVLERTNSQGDKVKVKVNRSEIGYRKAEGWVEIGGNYAPVKVITKAEEDPPKDDGGNGLTPAEIVAAAIEKHVTPKDLWSK